MDQVGLQDPVDLETLEDLDLPIRYQVLKRQGRLVDKQRIWTSEQDRYLESRLSCQTRLPLSNTKHSNIT